MGDTTGILWCDSTINLWIGCTKLSPACDFCYAELLGRRFGVEWDAPPKKTGDASWSKIASYQRNAARYRAKHGRARRVFINSLSDFFDNQAEDAWRTTACLAFERAPDVVWILVTKRPQNVHKMVPAHWLKREGWPKNVWLLVTAENQREHDRRVAELLAIPGPAIRGISMEPMLELIHPGYSTIGSRYERAQWASRVLKRPVPHETAGELSWVIIGGESGKHARPMPPAADVATLATSYSAGGIAVFVKQMSQAEYPGDSYKDLERFPRGLRTRRHPA